MSTATKRAHKKNHLWRGLSLSLGLCIAAGGVSTACGGDGDKDGEGGSKNGSNDDIAFGGDSLGGGAGTSGPQDGGRVDLTEEQVQSIGEAACTGWAGEGENLPAVLQLVVDVSGSMEDPAPGSRGSSKWEVTRDALEEAIAEMPASVAVGVLFYPNRGVSQSSSPREVDACVETDEIVPIAPLGEAMSDTRSALQDAIRQADVGSYTPTYDAYTYALEESLLPFQTTSKKFMLLITDGAPTLDEQCVDVPGGGNNRGGDAPTQPIIDEVASALDDHGVRTFLIGSPGSERSSESETDMRPWLSEAATLGGTSTDGCDEDGPEFCHLDMTQEPDFAGALSEGLARIAGQLIDSCTFQVPEPPDGEEIDANKTNLIVRWGDGKASLILPDNIGDCSDGWKFNDEGDVELCGDTCDEVKLDALASVSLNFGCSVDEIGIPVR